jgi:tetratricopeptide (TPR) repeat protein
MILTGSLATPAELERFRTEAENAAQLDHPNIVPVYEVGEWQTEGTGSRVPYFSMKLVEGGNLSQQVGHFSDDLRAAASLMATTAEAVHHAHQHGILHRDLKPANILLSDEWRVTRDETDHHAHTDVRPSPLASLVTRHPSPIPIITDFGLAKRIEGVAGQTHSGAILGTPSYMAPEQAMGQSKRLTTAADIYALGAILYELLAGRPPFKADTPLDTLMLVIHQEPVPPSRLRAGIPRDLETVCLKCLHKEPHNRYCSAAELADDLRRFLAGQPIQARLVSATEHVWRWACRQPALAGLSATLAVVVVASLLAVAWQWGEARMQRDDAEQQRMAADTARTHAEANYQKALAAVDRMLTRVGQQHLADVPEMEGVRRDILEDALQFCRQLLDERTDDPQIRQETGRAYARTAAIYALLGQLDESEDAWRNAAALQQALVANAPDSPQSQLDLAASYNGLAALLRDTGRSGEAIEGYDQALSIREAVCERNSDDPALRHVLAKTCNELGTLYAMTERPQQAETSIQRAIDLEAQLVREQPSNEEYLNGLASSHNSMGSFVLNVYGVSSTFGVPCKNVPRIEAAYLSALPIREELVKRFPASVGYQVELARVYKNIGTVYNVTARKPEAEPYLRKALELRTRIANEHPKVTSYRKAKAKSLYDLAFMLESVGRTDEAMPIYQEAIALQEELVASHPSAIEHTVDLGDTYHHAARLHFRRGELEAALPWLDNAVRTLRDVLEREPQHANARRFLGETYMTRGEVAQGLKRYADAVSDWTRAIEFPEAFSVYLLLLARAEAYVQSGDHRLAAEDLTTSLNTFPSDCRDRVKAAKISILCANAARRDQSLSADDAASLAENYTKTAHDILVEYLAAGGASNEIALDLEVAVGGLNPEK